MKFPNCSKCGSSNGKFAIRARPSGSVEMIIGNGGLLEILRDNELLSPNKTVRCFDCGKVRRDLMYENHEIRLTTQSSRAYAVSSQDTQPGSTPDCRGVGRIGGGEK